MIITCRVCGKNERIPITRGEYKKYVKEGQPIQVAFPNLPKEQREMIISQHCSKCWDFLFREEE